MSSLRKKNDSYLYYRLKQTDFNGDYNYFNIISVDECATQETQIINSYNDSGILTINIYSDSDQQFEINIYEVTGRKVLSSQYFLSKGIINSHLPQKGNISKEEDLTYFFTSN